MRGSALTMVSRLTPLLFLLTLSGTSAMPVADESDGLVFKSSLGSSGQPSYTLVPSAKDFDEEYVSYEPIDNDEFVSYEPIESSFGPPNERRSGEKFHRPQHGNFRVKDGHEIRPEDDLPPQPYQFEYGVRDHDSGADFQAAETQDPDGNVIGSYRVNLPDGRIQTVTYRADEHGGFKADVSYEGEASYPPEPEGGYAAAYQRRVGNQGTKKFNKKNNKFKGIVDVSEFEYE